MRLIKHFMDWAAFGLHGADYLVLSFFVLVLVFLIVFGIKWRRQNKFHRAKFTEKLLDKMNLDSEIQTFTHRIASGEEWYNDEFFENVKLQTETFHVLSFFNYICYLEENHVISGEEYMLFEYSIQNLAVNPSFQNYMFQLFHETEEEHRMFPFYYLLDSCAEKMPGGFLDAESKHYKKFQRKKRKESN